MPEIGVFSTAGLPAARRIELWERHNTAALIGLSCHTTEPGSLEATEVNVQLGGIQLARVTGSPHVVERTAGVIRHSPADAIAVYLTLRGHRPGLAAVSGGGDLQAGERSLRSGWAAARSFIEDHLADPGLGAARVAAAVAISERHLSRVFADGGTTLPRHILSRRLQLGYAMLADPARAGLTVADVAAACGFASAAYGRPVPASPQHHGHHHDRNPQQTRTCTPASDTPRTMLDLHSRTLTTWPPGP